MATKTAKVELKIGAVAYAPKVITIWEGMREYLRGQGLMTEYVLYSSYPALVDALVAGHIDSPGIRRLRTCKPRNGSVDNASSWECATVTWVLAPSSLHVRIRRFIRWVI
jgi:ABC-type phosphate/phosphonate transport system substrate-binding protein